MKQIAGHKTQLDYLRRLARTDRVPHALLFVGADGIGKYTIAKYFAQSMLCTAEEKPCGVCSRCTAFEHKRLMDVVEFDDESGSAVRVGQSDEPGTIRHLIARLSERSLSGGYIVLINGMERINEAGQNMLLKTIEEPGEGTRIVMTAPSKSMVLQTIRSRSVILDFFPLAYGDVCRILNVCPEHHSVEEAAILASGGSVSLASQLMEDNRVLEIIDLGGEIVQAVKTARSISPGDASFDKRFKDFPCITVLIHLFRYVLRIVSSGQLQYNAHIEKLYIDDTEMLHSLIKMLLQTNQDQRLNVNVKGGIKAAVYTLIEENFRRGVYSNSIRV